jgi:hypothetical protein
MVNPKRSPGFVLLFICELCLAQTFQRLGACPTFGCIFPPDQYVLHFTQQLSEVLTTCRVEHLAGQYFDIRLEVHAPANGSQAVKNAPDEKFAFTIAKGQKAQNAASYLKVEEPKLEKWNFTWYEGEATAS